MKQIKKISVLIMSVLLVLSQTELSARAVEPQETIFCLELKLDGGNNDIGFSDYVIYNGQNELEVGTTYYVNEDRTFDGTITVKGLSNNYEETILILGSGVTLTVNGGMNVASGKSLKIYSKSGATMGSLVTTGSDFQAGIGGGYEEDGGAITIYSGNINATGGKGAAGIGGGYLGKNNGDIAINGGNVIATGATAIKEESGDWLYGGAGIGGGNGGSGGKITINNGNVTAVGGDRASGIGGSNAGDGGEIIIQKGQIEAHGGPYSAGIGGGYNGAAGHIQISGGTVYSKCEGLSGPGIGSGTGGSNSGKIEVTGEADITAIGGANGAGIGGGKNAGTAEIIIVAGNINATGGTFAAGIGSGSNSNETPKESKDINISGGTINAVGGLYGGAGIGGGVSADTGNITISGGTIKATGGSLGGAGIGSGKDELDLEDDFSVNISGGSISAKGQDAAAIGKGLNRDGVANITIDPKFGSITEEDLLAGNIDLSDSKKKDKTKKNTVAAAVNDAGSFLSFSFRGVSDGNNGGKETGCICTIDKQGPLCVAVFEAATPKGFTEAFSFNLNMDITGISAPDYEKKAGLFVLNIPESLKKEGRTFALIGVDINGVPKLFYDIDSSDETFTTNLDMDGYAFSFIYD